MKFLYLHGFASSPRSSKALAFQSALAESGVSLQIPALDEGDFEHLTLSGQLALVESTLGGEPACIIGSSMGGYLAALYAAGHPEISRLVLLAPAFGFASRWQARWRKSMNEAKPAALEVFHYGDQAMRRIHYGLIEDALQYPAVPDFTQPALIFHGIHDDVVPVESSRNFAAAHANARLIELDSDHGLLNVLERIVSEAVPFLIA